MFMAPPVEAGEFNKQVESIEKKIESGDSVAAGAEIRTLKINHELDRSQGNKINLLNNQVFELENQKRDLEAIKRKTTGPEWDAMVKAIQKKEGLPVEQAAQLQKAKDLIEKSYDDIDALIALPEKPYNYLAQIEAHNSNVVKTKSLDESNAELSGAAEAIVFNTLAEFDAELAVLTTDHGTYMLRLEPLLQTAENIKAAANPTARKTAEDIVDTSAKAQKTLLETKIQTIVTAQPYNVEKQIATVFANIKDIDAVVNARLGRKAVVAPAGAPTSIPGIAIDLFKKVLERIPALAKDIAAKGKDAADALLKAAQDKLNPEQKAKFAEDLNKELKNAGSTKHAEVNKDGNVELKDGAQTEEKNGAEVPKEVQTKLDKIIEFLTKIFELLRGEALKRGDPVTLQSEVERITAEIDKLKKTPGLTDKPDVKAKIQELEQKKVEMQSTIEQNKKRAEKLVTEANAQAERDRLAVTAGVDTKGRPYVCPKKSVPGVTPEQSKAQVECIVRKILKENPSIVAQQMAGTEQGVVFLIKGDLNINSKNNFSRTNNSTSTVLGNNNSTTASPTQNQNGDNEFEGDIDGRLQAEAKNKAKQSSVVSPTAPVSPSNPPATAPKPNRPQVVNATPSTGSLS